MTKNECWMLDMWKKITPADDFLPDSSFILSDRHSFGAGISRNRNSMEFLAPDSPGQKIPWNPGRRSLQDEKFHGIPDAGVSGTKNSMESRTL
jgi:hypothetical protein